MHSAVWRALYITLLQFTVMCCRVAYITLLVCTAQCCRAVYSTFLKGKVQLYKAVYKTPGLHTFLLHTVLYSYLQYLTTVHITVL